MDRRPGRDGRRGAGGRRPLLRALPAEPFDATETAAPRVNAKALVTIGQNRYSVPVALVGLKVSARIGAREITITHVGRTIARHERLQGRFGTSAQLDHYRSSWGRADLHGTAHDRADEHHRVQPPEPSETSSRRIPEAAPARRAGAEDPQKMSQAGS